MADNRSEDVIVIQVNRASDPDGGNLRSLLRAHLSYEKARQVRQRWSWLSAIAAVLAVVSFYRPISEVSYVHALITALAGVLLMRMMIAAGREWRCYQQWSALSERSNVQVT